MGATESVVVWNSKVVTDSITRPANTTAYSAGDAISEVTTNDHFTFSVFKDQHRKYASIDAAWLMSSVDASALDAELWLFHTAPTETADNSAFAPPDAERLTLLGVIDFPDTTAKSASNWSVCQATGLVLPIRGTAENIYGQLVARNAYTPSSGEVFTVNLSLSIG